MAKDAVKTSGGFDFSKAESAKELSFLVPGVYSMKITEVKLGTFTKGKAYLGITLTTDEGVSYTEKLGFDSDKQKEIFMSRLQYLHEAWRNKKLDKIFKSVEEIEAYFSKTFTDPKASAKNVIIGGDLQPDGKVYANLPFTGFIADADSDLELGPFEEGDANWKKYVRKAKKNSEVAGKPNGILNSGTGSKDDEDESKSDSEETPWG